jgi:CRP/FNR family transcriptional regulator, cyclic AMP receptor protein
MTNGQPDILNGLTPDEAQQALALGKRITVPAGSALFELGAAAECIYLIERGRIRLTLPMQVRGRDEDVMVEERIPGQAVGWSALIPPYRFTLKATAPLETEVLALARKDLMEHFAANPKIGYSVSLNLAAVIGQRLQLFQAMWLREIQRTVELRHA